MDDLSNIELYFARDEQAIKETDNKYGKLCHSIAYNIKNFQKSLLVANHTRTYEDVIKVIKTRERNNPTITP